MVLLDFGTGLRRGELSGVRWEDICFEDKVLIPKRSIVKQRICKVKTEASKKSSPLDDLLISKNAGLAPGNSLFPRQPLRLRQYKDERQAAVLDESDHAVSHQAIRRENRDRNKGLAHITPLLHDPAAAEQQQPRSIARPIAACLVLNHDECLRRSYV